MIDILDKEDNVICSVDDYDELRYVLFQLRRKQTVYVDMECGFFEFPKIEASNFININEFRDLVIEYGYMGDTLTDYAELRDSEKEIVQIAWRDAHKTENKYGNLTDDEYCQETYAIIDSYYFDFIEEINKQYEVK